MSDTDYWFLVILKALGFTDLLAVGLAVALFGFRIVIEHALYFLKYGRVVRVKKGHIISTKDEIQ